MLPARPSAALSALLTARLYTLRALGVSATLVALSSSAAAAATAAPSAPPPAKATAAPTGDELYARSVAADDHVSYSSTLTSVVYEGDRAVSTVTRVEHKAPHAWRIWYLAPADAYGRMIVSNESLAYQYEPTLNRVIKHDWSSSAPGIATPVDVPRVESNYSVEIGPRASVAGRQTVSLSLVSRHTGEVVQRLWVDGQTDLILRRETYTSQGSVASKSSFDSIRIGVDQPQALFDLTVPSGMTLVDSPNFGKSTTDTASLVRGLNFTFAAPKYLPDGFALERGSVESHQGVNTVEFVYGDGLRMFSLFENASGRLPRFDRASPKPISIGTAEGQYADLAGQTLVSWNAGGLNLTIVGDLSSKEIATIGASIHP
jgi:outer membrane lipoprotein-sorting protein